MKFDVLACDRPDWDGLLFMKCVTDDGGLISRRFTQEELATKGLVQGWIAECRRALLSRDEATIQNMMQASWGDALGSLGAAITAGKVRVTRGKPGDE